MPSIHSSPNSPQQLRSFLLRQLLPLSFYQSRDGNVHNPDTAQLCYPIPQRLTHPSDLSIASFGENDAEPCETESFNLATLGRTLKYDDSLSHAVNERLIEWMID
jgi:hypothetical protein